MLAAANEESLERHRSAPAREREHIGIAGALGVRRAPVLDIGQRLQPITIYGRQFEIERVGRRLHRIAQLFLHGRGFAREEGLGIGDQLAVSLCRYPADARGRAALDLMRSEEHTSELQSLMRIS